MTIEPPETIRVANTRVSCDGGGALGHPRVWLEMGENETVECPYCDRVFQLSCVPQKADQETPRRGSQKSGSA